MAVLKARENSTDSFEPVATMGVGNASQSQRGLMTAQDKVKLDTLVNLLVPVGVILTFANDINPNNIYAGTTWEKIEGRFLLGSSSDYALGSTGGSADAVVVGHTHTVENAGQHQHYWSRYDLDILGGPSSTNGYKTSSAITNVLTQPAGDHTHTINNAGVSGVGKNMPPYEVVNYWKRTA